MSAIKFTTQAERKAARCPLIDPLLLALKSRRVIVAVAALVVGALTLAVPELNAVRAELLTLVMTLALALIGGYSIEDAAEAARGRPAEIDEADLRRLLRDLADGLLDELDVK